MVTLVQQIVDKMGLHDEPKVLEKTTELVRLLELRSSNVPLQVNDSGKIVLCAHLASEYLQIPIDKEQALKLAGLKKSAYASNKRMCEKLLDMTKIVGVKEICLQLGLEDVADKANHLLELYKNIILKTNADDVDLEHPQYASMAVYFACKLNKRKFAKTKIMPFSNLRPQQFQQLEHHWEKFITQHYNDAMAKNLVPQQEAVNGHSSSETTASAKIKANEPIVEDYEKWKSRVLSDAKRKLRAFEKENVH